MCSSGEAIPEELPADLPPASLAQLIELEEVVPQRVWREEELGAILAHELATPPWLELGELKLAAVAIDGAPGPASLGLRLASLGDLLHHPRPPLEMLIRLKDFAKTQRHSPSSHLPEPVAAVLYALATAAALVRHDHRITSLDNPALAKHLQWALDRPWLDSASSALLKAALDRDGHQEKQ